MTGRLFVGDDERVFIDYLATWLGLRWLAVDVFDSGPAPIEGSSRCHAARRAPRHLLPDLNGLETLMRIREVHAGAQVSMLSTGNAPATAIRDRARGLRLARPTRCASPMTRMV